MEASDTKIFIEDGGEIDPSLLTFRKYRKTALTEAVVVLRPFKVVTLEGTFEAKAGDYLMRGPAGELYSCDAKIFEDTYEEAFEESESADDVLLRAGADEVADP